MNSTSSTIVTSQLGPRVMGIKLAQSCSKDPFWNEVTANFDTWFKIAGVPHLFGPAREVEGVAHQGQQYDDRGERVICRYKRRLRQWPVMKAAGLRLLSSRQLLLNQRDRQLFKASSSTTNSFCRRATIINREREGGNGAFFLSNGPRWPARSRFHGVSCNLQIRPAMRAWMRARTGKKYRAK